jgi:hypothetical protein
MSKLFNTLRDVLTPYANKINLHTEEIEELGTTLKNVGTHGRLLGLEWKNKNYSNLTTGNVNNSSARISVMNLVLNGLYKITCPSNMDIDIIAIDPEWDGTNHLLTTGWINGSVYIKTISGLRMVTGLLIHLSIDLLSNLPRRCYFD